MMNKPILYAEFNPLPLEVFLGIMTYACKRDYVDVVKYFNENKVKGVDKNNTAYFYFTIKIVKFLSKVSKNYYSQNVRAYLRGIRENVTNTTNEDKEYEKLIHFKKFVRLFNGYREKIFCI